MTNIRNWVALNATAVLVAASLSTFAQDDLDDLLKDLEGGSAKPAAKAEAKPEAAAPEVPARPQKFPEMEVERGWRSLTSEKWNSARVGAGSGGEERWWPLFLIIIIVFLVSPETPG